MITTAELLKIDGLRDEVEGHRLDSPLYRIRPAEIINRVRRLQRAFAGRIGFDIRTNPHPAVIRALRSAGVRMFSACSAGDAAAVDERDELGFHDPYASVATLRQVVRAHPAARFAADGLDTLDRLRRATDNAARAVSIRIGGPVDEILPTIRAARDAGLDVGIALHPGADDAAAARAACALAAELCTRASLSAAPIDLGLTKAGAPPAELDAAEAICRAVSEEMQRLGLHPARVSLTPAAALVGSACSVVTRVQLRKGDRLYLDEGRFGWLYILGRPRWRDLPPLPVRAYRMQGDRAVRLPESTIVRYRAFGPTCDSYDELEMPLLLPHEVAEGDFIEIDGIGADSVLCATHFNGFYSNRYTVVGES